MKEKKKTNINNLLVEFENGGCVHLSDESKLDLESISLCRDFTGLYPAGPIPINALKGLEQYISKIQELDRNFEKELDKIRVEEIIIISIIEKYTKEPWSKELEDKTAVIKHNDYSDRYILVYDFVKLGMIKLIEENSDFAVEFIPGKFDFK